MRYLYTASVAVLAALLLVAASTAASSKVQLKPTAGSYGPAPNYKPLGAGTKAQAQWTNKTSLDGMFSVLLQKSVPTSDPSSAYAAAEVQGVVGLTITQLGPIGFYVQGNCGAGSPRFNLYYDTNGDGVADGVAFYGCGNHVSDFRISARDGSAWTGMTADSSTPDFCYSWDSLGYGPCTLTAASIVTSLSVLVDEQGTYYIDDVLAAGQTVGEPNGS